MFFWSRKTEGKIVLLLEIESSLVRGSLVWIRPDVVPQVLSVDSRPVPHRSHTDTAYFVKVTMHALTQTIEAVGRRFHIMKHDHSDKTKPRRIAEVHYILSSPWAVSRARTISIGFEKTTKINPAKIHNIIESERARIVPQSPESATEIIEEKVFDVRLNGYSVPNWQNLETRELEISYALTVGSVTMSRRFRDAVSHIVPERRVHFHSSLLLQYLGLTSILPEHRTYTLLHVHGDLTDVAVVKHHSCIFFGSYPSGIRTIVRKVAKASKTDEGLADSTLSLYVGGKLETEQARKLKPVIEDLGAGWVAEFKDLFKDSDFKGAVPDRTVIIARAHEDFFAASLRRAAPSAEVESLAQESLASHVAFDSKAEPARMVGVYVAALCDII